MPDPRVEAIRNDPVVGKGSASSIDECWSDTDLIKALDLDKKRTVLSALRWARSAEKRYLERGLDCRWGEDSDPQLKAYRDFKRACKDNPTTRRK